MQDSISTEETLRSADVIINIVIVLYNNYMYIKVQMRYETVHYFRGGSRKLTLVGLWNKAHLIINTAQLQPHP